MKRLLALVAVTVFVAGPAWADHQTDPPADTPSSSLLDVEIKLGKEGFRIGGRLFGSGGVAGAWLNGQLNPNGFQLDGRVQDEHGRARNFKLDAEMTDWLTRSGWQWLLGRSLGP
jgi:hypothetical protein